jgi:AcrR family transcriptional regulator
MAAPERRTALIAAAKDAFAERGFAATSMDDVAAAAGVSRLIVYRHFDSKEALYDVVVAEVASTLVDALHESIDTPGAAAVRALLTVARADPNGFTVLWQHAAREPQFAAHAAGFRAPAVAFVRTLLTRAGVADDRVGWAAETLLSFAIAAVTHWVEHEPPERDDEFLSLMATSVPPMIRSWAEQPSRAR